MFSKIFGVVLLLAGLFFAMEAFSIGTVATSAMHEIYLGVMILCAIVGVAGGAILCALGEANQHLRSMRNMETEEYRSWREDRDREHARKNTPPVGQATTHFSAQDAKA